MDFVNTFMETLNKPNEKMEKIPIDKNDYKLNLSDTDMDLCYKYNITPLDLEAIKDKINLGLEKKEPDKLVGKTTKPDNEKLVRYLNKYYN